MNVKNKSSSIEGDAHEKAFKAVCHENIDTKYAGIINMICLRQTNPIRRILVTQCEDFS